MKRSMIYKEQILFVLESVRYFLPNNFRQHGVLTPVMLFRRKSPKTFFALRGIKFYYTFYFSLKHYLYFGKYKNKTNYCNYNNH